MSGGRPRTDDRLTVALALAAQGVHVFPVEMPAKRPRVQWGDAATTDPEAIATWWGERPGDAVGYHAGRSRLVGVDVDEKGGVSGTANLAAAGIDLPPTLTYATPSGGSHHVYAAPTGRPLTIAQGHPVEGVDIRAGVGFLIWYADAPPADLRASLAPAPEWSLLEPRRATTVLRGGEAARRTVEYRRRLDRPDARPSKAVRRILAGVTATGMSHAAMLEAVTALVRAGLDGEPGVGAALDAARATYAAGWPEADRRWDDALDGSVQHHGLPPATFRLSKVERRAVQVRNAPEAIVQAKRERRAVRHEQRAAAEERPDGEVSDAALAAELAEKLRDEWAHAPGIGLLRYDGVVWRTVDEALLVERCRRMLTAVRAEETRTAIYRGDTKHEKLVMRLTQRTTIAAVARLVAGILLEHPPALDADPDLLNCPNGVVDLRTGELTERRPDHYFTKVTGADFVPELVDAAGAADPAVRDWARALKAVPKGTRRWLQVRLGQAATGRISPDKAVPFLLGGGDNGKSTLLGACRAALGSYAVTVPDRLLLGSENDHPTDVMTLRGARLAVFEELPRGGRLNAQRLKLLAGTNELSGRLMRQDFVTFQASHTLVGGTNHLPIITDVDEATWNRVAPVPFPFKFVRGEPAPDTNQRRGDRDLRDRLAERPSEAALAWLVAGAVQSYRSIPDRPRAVTKRLADWRAEADPVLSFVRDRLDVVGGSVHIAAADLYSEFGQYLEQRNQARWSDQLIAAAMATHSSLEGVEKRAVRRGQGVQSRPELVRLSLQEPPERYQAWVGLRFRPTRRLTSEADRDAAELADLERRARTP